MLKGNTEFIKKKSLIPNAIEFLRGFVLTFQHSSSFSSPLSRGDSRSRIRKYDNDDIPQEKVARIYQEELVKLMSRPQEPQLPLPRDPQYPGILFPFLGQSLLFNRSHEEVKLALDAYHQELSKLQGNAAVTGMGLGAVGE